MDEDDKEKMSEKATIINKPAAAINKSSKKEPHAGKRSASKVGEPEVDRSKVTETNNSIERIALFGEGSETGGAKF